MNVVVTNRLLNESLFAFILLGLSLLSGCKAVPADPDPTPEPPAKNTLALLSAWGGSRIEVLDLTTNQRKWAYQGEQVLYPEVYKDLVFFVDQANLNAVSLTTGAVQWKKWIGRQSKVEYSGLSVVDGTIYFCTPGDDLFPNSFYAIDALTGTINWKFTDTAMNVDSPNKRYELMDASQVIDQERKAIYFSILFNGLRRRLYAFDLPSGRNKWAIYAKGDNPLLQPNTNSLLTTVDSLYAYDANTGLLRSTVKRPPVKTIFAGNCLAANPTDARTIGFVGTNPLTGLFDNGFVVRNLRNLAQLNQAVKKTMLCSTDRTIKLVDASTGTEKWTFEISYSNNMYNVQLTDKALFATQIEGYIHAVDLTTGRMLWKSAEKAGVTTNLVLANDVLYGVTTTNGKGPLNTLTTFNPANGAAKPIHTVSFAPNRILIIDEKGTVFASPFVL